MGAEDLPAAAGVAAAAVAGSGGSWGCGQLSSHAISSGLRSSEFTSLPMVLMV